MGFVDHAKVLLRALLIRIALLLVGCATHLSWIANFIWGIADDVLRDPCGFVPGVPVRGRCALEL